MSRKVIVYLIDDFDGKAADETVLFGLDGVTYEIDLSAKNAKKLRANLQPWVHCGPADRRISPAPRCWGEQQVNRSQAKRRNSPVGTQKRL